MFSKQSTLINETTYKKISALLEARNPHSTSFPSLLASLDDLQLPPIDFESPHLTINKLVEEWTSIKSLLRLLLLDRLHLAKENQNLYTCFLKASQQSEGPATTRESCGYSDQEYSPKTVRQTLMDTYEFNQMLAEEGCQPVSFCMARPRHRKRSSSFNSIVMEEGSAKTTKIGRIIPSFRKHSK